MSPAGYLLSFLCGQPLWRYSLAAQLIFLISEWSIEGFDWTTVSDRRIQKPRTRRAEISPVSLKNNSGEEWRCSDLGPWSQRAAGATCQRGRTEGSLWADRKRLHLLQPLFVIPVKMMDTPALLRIFPHPLVFALDWMVVGLDVFIFVLPWIHKSAGRARLLLVWI